MSDFTAFTNDAAGESVSTTLPRKVVTYAWAVKVCEFILDREPENLGVRQALARNQAYYWAFDRQSSSLRGTQEWSQD
jgi:hypothetical protein